MYGQGAGNHIRLSEASSLCRGIAAVVVAGRNKADYFLSKHQE